MPSAQPDVQVFNETGFSLPLSASDFKRATKTVAEKEDCHFGFIELVYVDETEIVRINRKHLDRDYITDIITFRYDENNENNIEGTIFCCAPRIAEQAEEWGEAVEREFLRVFIHGLLHLNGYEDKTETQKQRMTGREDYYLKLLER